MNLLQDKLQALIDDCFQQQQRLRQRERHNQQPVCTAEFQYLAGKKAGLQAAQALLTGEHKRSEPFTIIWTVEDVQTIRPDLSIRQCQDVLRELDDRYDPALGVTWQTVEVYSDELFPNNPKEPLQPSDHEGDDNG